MVRIRIRLNFWPLDPVPHLHNGWNGTPSGWSTNTFCYTYEILLLFNTKSYHFRMHLDPDTNGSVLMYPDQNTTKKTLLIQASYYPIFLFLVRGDKFAVFGSKICILRLLGQYERILSLKICVLNVIKPGLICYS